MSSELTLHLDQASRLEAIANNSNSCSARLIATAFIVASRDGFKEVVNSASMDFYRSDIEFAIQRIEKLSKEAEQKQKNNRT